MFEPKCKPAHFLQINQLKLKRETKVLQEEAFLSLYLVIKTITLHCKVVSSKLLENLFHTAQIYQYSILQLNHQKYLWKLVHNMLDCFTHISISHLYARVNLIALTKFHCLNCTVIVGKNFIYTETCF